jgi:hypothetical protein
MRARERRGIRRRAVAAALLAAACGPREPAKTAGGAPPAPAQWFRGRLRQLPPWADDLRRRIDPAADGWPTETWALAIERELPGRLRAALGGDLRGLESLLADDFAGATDLWPASLESAFDDGDTTVRRGRDLSAALRPRTELAQVVEAWRASLRDAPDARVDLAVDGLEVGGLETGSEGTFTTAIRLRVSGAAGTGSVQQNARWKATWRAPAAGGSAGPPRLLSLALERLEEVRTRVRPFAELTREVLSSCEGFEEEILRGNDDYHLHQDRLSSQPMLGMHGLAVGDVDGDGLEDLYLPQPGGQPNRLLLHQPDGTVKDGTRAAGLDVLDNCGSALILDLDNDGHEDVVIASGSNLLIGWNDGHGRFRETTVLAGPDDPEITSLSAADADGDGDLDLFACRYVKGGVSNGAPVPYWNAQNGAPDLYWRNEGGHRFVEASKEVGLDVHGSRYGLAVLWEDFDDDGDMDLFVVNDFGKCCLYRNDGGKFTDVGEEAGVTFPAAGMGVSCADVDHDGHLDLFLTNMDSPAGARITEQPRFMADQPANRAAYLGHARGNTLLLGDGHGKFRNATAEAGVGPGGWAWGGTFFDLQNDGWPDLYVPNGFATNRGMEDLSSFFWRCVVARSPADEPPTVEYLNAWDALRQFSLFEGRTWNGRERNFAYLNLGQGKFAEASSAFGIDYQDDGRVVAPVDWDDDGRVDLWIRNRTGPRLRFVHNVDPAAGHWITLQLAGTTCNRDAIGARAFVEAGGVRLQRTVYAAEGFMCGGSRRLHFGLGKATKAEKIEVRWPGGGSQTFTDVAADARYRAVQGRPALERMPPRPHPALAAMPADPVQVESRDVSRIVLYERLPARALEIPATSGEPRTLGALDGRAVLVWVGYAADPASSFLLEKLAASRKDFDANGVSLIALECGDDSAQPEARKRIDALGLGALAGRADKRFLQDLQVLVMEVLGPFDRLAFPLSLLFDRGGQLTVVYSGVPRFEDLVLDARITLALDPKGLSTEPLLRGRWARPFARNLEGLGQIFDLLGDTDLAGYYHGLARARAGH